ncbi:MAG: class I SAM-dependent methyltransferase [Bacteroidia bacterium]|nr:class I SAM-dependent methyltransferase [Bacteroidia bacterium]
MTPEYYKEYYHLERSNWWFTARLEILKNQIEVLFPKRNDLNILNIGVATGATSQMLEKFGNVKSIEYDEVCFNFVKDNLKIDIEKGTILDLQFAENSFDLVCAFDVVEHVENDQLAVKEMIRVCKSNGIVFVTVPAFMDLWSKHDEINYHFKRYIKKTLLPLFNLKSGSIAYHSYFNTILFIPIYLVRWISNKFPNLFKRDGSGSDHSMFELGFLNKVLYTIFYAENFLLKRLVKLPFGVSLMLIFKKK